MAVYPDIYHVAKWLKAMFISLFMQFSPVQCQSSRGAAINSLLLLAPNLDINISKNYPNTLCMCTYSYTHIAAPITLTVIS